MDSVIGRNVDDSREVSLYTADASYLSQTLGSGNDS